MHSELSRLIRSRAHYGPIPAPCHDDRLASEMRIIPLLHGRIKRVHVDMNDLASGHLANHLSPAFGPSASVCSNHDVAPNLLVQAHILHVPGPASLLWETGVVPRGEIHHHFYQSGVVGNDQDFFVYTPPGYNPRGKQTYPVLYLLHGFGYDASCWTVVGRSNVIMDNLIAQGKAKPMLVVMPLGYGAPEVLAEAFGPSRDRAVKDRNFDKFRKALLTEVIPRVEAEYLVNKDSNSRAIAGLSMGGAESLLTGLNALDKFAWIGAFSSGGITEEFDKEFPALDSKTAEQLRLLWIACGTDDPASITINRAFRAWLASKNIKHVDIETPGAHTWMVWRRNLAEFTSLLR